MPRAADCVWPKLPEEERNTWKIKQLIIFSTRIDCKRLELVGKKKEPVAKKKEPVDSSWKWQSPRFEPHSPQNSLLLFIVRMAIVKWIYFSKIATFWWWNRFKVTRSCIFIDGKENCEVPFVPKRLFSCIFQTLFTFPRPWLNAEVETFWFIIFFWQLSGPFACWGVQHILASHFIARAHFRDVQAWRDFRGRSQHLNANDQ